MAEGGLDRVLVTGAASGIGLAITRKLIATGSTVLMSDRDAAGLERARTELDASPQATLLIPGDLTDDQVIGEVAEKAGRLTGLVNCAGISQRGKALETELLVDRHLMELNYFGPVALTKLVLPSMIARGDGQVVVVSSLMGKLALPGRGAYAASKHALHGFFDALRAEVSHRGIPLPP